MIPNCVPKMCPHLMEIFNRPHPRPRAYTNSGRRKAAPTPTGWSSHSPCHVVASRGNWTLLFTPAVRSAGVNKDISHSQREQREGKEGTQGACRRKDGALGYRRIGRRILESNPVKSDRHAESSKALSASKQMRPGPVAGAVPRAYASRGKRKTKECRHHFKEE